MFRPRHYAADIALELVNGFRDGTIALESSSSRETKQRKGRLFSRREALTLGGALGALASFVFAIRAFFVSPEQAVRAELVERLLSLRTGKPIVNPTELQRFRDKVAKTEPSSKAYWRTVYRIINLQSEATLDVSKLKRPIFVLDLRTLPSHRVFQGQIVILSGSGMLDTTQFIDCLVSFSDLKEPVIFSNVRFIHCGFFIPTVAETSRPVKKIAEALIASRDISDISVSVSVRG